MKFAAILILLYVLLGFIAGLRIAESRKAAPPRPNAIRAERPPLEIPLQILLLGLLLTLPFYGYRRSKRQGTFLRFGPRAWLYGPPALAALGFVSAFPAFRYL